MEFQFRKDNFGQRGISQNKWNLFQWWCFLTLQLSISPHGATILGTRLLCTLQLSRVIIIDSVNFRTSLNYRLSSSLMLLWHRIKQNRPPPLVTAETRVDPHSLALSSVCVTSGAGNGQSVHPEISLEASVSFLLPAGESRSVGKEEIDSQLVVWATPIPMVQQT